MGKIRDLFKNIRDTKGTFPAKRGTIKDRNGMDLTEAEDKKRWQEYTEELYKKDLLCWNIEKARKFQKNNFCFIDYAKAFDCVDQNKLWKILKRDGDTRPPDLSFEKPVCRSRSNSWNWTWSNELVQNWESRLFIVTLLIYLRCKVHHAKCPAG